MNIEEDEIKIEEEKSCRLFAYKPQRVGFIATRLAGTDGVSLETAKWAHFFKKEGFTCFYFAGECDCTPELSYIVPEAHFKHPNIRKIHRNCFKLKKRSDYVSQEIHELRLRLKKHLYNFIRQFKIDLLVAENCLTIPLNIPLGVAIAELISETGIPTIAHHHDFFWERQAFMRNAVWEYLNMAFPPHLPQIQHVVINSSAKNQISLRTGISPTIIPNVMDFDNPPESIDDYASDVRKAFGVEDDQLFILQPTRVVERKRIELAIELINRLGKKAKLVISHASGDEGYDYECRVKEYACLMGVDTVFVSDIINEKRGFTKSGKKIYTLNDIYPHADLVTYPSDFEGFGNAFLEAIYFRKPIMVNAYSIYSMDIRPKGFSVIEINGYITDKSIKQVEKVLEDEKFRGKMVDHNYEIAKNCYSYSVLHKKLKNLLEECTACEF
ncbi:MAG: glycosyltransferase family 4 protein [Desulfobacteraceae bacterium]|nr:glycosyltransferase family 4 protein [Desulfobacteraceae bacterium]MBC2720364.1 glycosyltransferase family 4 protein [Desulfobacteraceae bacterium]